MTVFVAGRAGKSSVAPSSRLFGAVALASLVLLAICVPAGAQVSPITLQSVPYTVAGQQFYEQVYLYPTQEAQGLVLVNTAFGLIVADSATGQTSYRGFATQEIANRPSDACPFPQVIDRHQGVRGYRAVGNWLVIGNYGGSPSCQEAVIFTRQGSNYVKVGDVHVPNFFPNSPSVSYGILGDFAWIPTGIGATWSKIDLNTRTVVETNSVFMDSPELGNWELIQSAPLPPNNYQVRLTANPLAPPTSSASMTNASAATRPVPENGINYYGDRWSFVDASTTFLPSAPINGIEWDFLYTGSPPLLPDVAINPPADPTPWRNFFGYFPCGNPADLLSGSAACAQGPAIPSGRVAMRTRNVNGWATNQWDSPLIAFTSPAISIVGYTAGTLAVLTGGNAIATGTKGNIAEANFEWTFTPGGSQSGINLHTVPVPAGATSFSLRVTWKGGYQSTVSGNVVQTQLVPNFSLSPNPVVKGQPITVQNQMQLGSVTLGSVEYAVTTSSATPGTYDGQLAATFHSGCTIPLPGGGTTCPPSATAAVTAPGVVGSYYMHLRYNHSGGNAFTFQPFQAVDVPPFNPQPTPYQNSAGTILAQQFNGVFQLSTGTPYFLFDDDAQASQPGYPGVSFSLVTTSGESAIGTPNPTPAGNRGPVSWTPSANCQTGCSIKATVGTISRTQAVVISTAPTGGVNVTLSGPTAGNVGQPLSFNASATGPGSISYRWDCNYSGVGPPTLTLGGPSQQCTFATPGGKIVLVEASSGQSSDQAFVSVTITQAGPPPPATSYSITGASLNPLNGRYEVEAGKAVQFTSTETRASSWTWTIPGFTQLSGQNVVYTFPQAGAFSVQLSVTGNGTQTVGTSNATIGFTVTPPAFRWVIVPDAASIDAGGDTWGTAVTLANPSSTSSIALAMAFVLFSPDAPQNQSLTSLQYVSPMTLAPGASWATADIVRHLGIQTPEGASNKGTVFVKYEGNTAPIASSRVTFAPKTNPGNISYGAVLPSFRVDAAGNVTPQGLITWSEDGLTPAQAISAPAATMDVTVQISGSGSGSVVSNPGAINCPGTCTATFDDALTANVILQAVPAAGSTAVWGTSSCDTINPMNGGCVLSTFNGPRTVTVTFNGTAPPPPPPTGNSSLQVNKSGSGSGTVTSNPAGISCGGTCSANFTTNSTVTLSAEAATGSTFGGWSGACSGFGACVVTLSSNQTVGAVFNTNAQPPPSGQPEEQALIGMRSDDRYRFGVTIFNASGSEGQFQIRILDANNATVIFKDENGADVGARTFTIKAFQSVYLTDVALGLAADLSNPSTWKTYVVAVKRLSASGKLVGYGTSIDRTTRDFIRVVDDHQVATAGTNGLVVHEIPASSRFDSPSGAKWRTDLRLLNRATRPRNLTVQYHYGQAIGQPLSSASAQVTIAANAMLTWDDVIGTLVDQDPSVDLVSISTIGVLRIYYAADTEESSAPLVISSRNYDDQPAGTSGTQIPSYTSAQYAASGQNLYLTGVEESARYEGRIGVFSGDGAPATGRIAVLRPDGSEAGSIGFSVGAAGSQRLLQLTLTGIPGFLNPQAPVTVRVEVTSGRAAAYAFNVDRITKDTSFIQGFPLN